METAGDSEDNPKLPCAGCSKLVYLTELVRGRCVSCSPFMDKLTHLDRLLEDANQTIES